MKSLCSRLLFRVPTFIAVAGSTWANQNLKTVEMMLRRC